MIVSACSTLTVSHRGFPRGIVGVRESRVSGTRGGSGMVSSSAARVRYKPAARPGGFGCADRLMAGLGEARGTYPTERRVHFGPSRPPG